MAQNYQDAMSIVRKFGKPDLFVILHALHTGGKLFLLYFTDKNLKIDLTLLPEFLNRN
jgi:hypothetical protein